MWRWCCVAGAVQLLLLVSAAAAAAVFCPFRCWLPPLEYAACRCGPAHPPAGAALIPPCPHPPALPCRMEGHLAAAQQLGGGPWSTGLENRPRLE